MILLAILIVGGFFVLAEYTNKKNQPVYTNEIVNINKNTDKNPENSADWKKVLLANENTDTKTVKDLTQKQETLTATDILGRDFFARYMEMRQMGNINDKANQDELISQVLKNGVLLANPKVYTIADVITINDDSAAAIKKYGNDIGQVFKTYTIKSRNETVIAKDAMDKGDNKILEELNPIITSYRNILNGIIRVKTPQSFSKLQLNLINSMSSLLFVVENLKKISSDPFTGVQAASKYIPSVQMYASAVNAIKDQMILQGIKYSPDEYGVFFIPN